MVYNHLAASPPFVTDNRLYKSESEQEISHLLQRCFFSIPETLYNKLKTKKRSDVIHDLLYAANNNTFPLKDYLITNANNPDSNIDFGKSWIIDDNYDYSINKKRKESLKNWFISKLYTDDEGLRPKMILFWNNFFSIELAKITFARKAYNYLEIISKNALDNYKDLLIEIILDQTILQYVSKINSSDKKNNELFAEIILAEYTIGKNYYELIGNRKFRKLVRLLNEWSLIADSFALYHKKSKKSVSNKFHYDSYLNTPTVKDFVIELKMYFDFIFKYPEVSKNITRKVFSFFLHTEIDEEAEKKFIEPVSEIFTSCKYDIKSLLNAFFYNNYFYNKKYIGSFIKSPVDFVFGICKEFGVYTHAIGNTIEHYYYWNFLRMQIELLGQNIGDSPGYNVRPESIYFTSRNTFVDKIFDSRIQCGNNILKINTLKFASALNYPWNPDSLINESISILFKTDLSQKLKTAIKRHFLLDEQEDDHEWTNKWEITAKNPGNEGNYNYVSDRLKELYKFLLKRPEYHYK